ncbi:MAG: CocE/NonD family hydrolase, partial [Gaiellales bacterium]
PFFSEASDVAHSIEWASTLAGGDGRVATYGFSYPGLGQLLAAQRKPDGLACIAPALTAGSPYREWFYAQGAFELAFAASWANYLALDTARSQADLAAYGQLAVALAGSAGGFWSLPIAQYPPLAGQEAGYFFDWVAHPTFDEYWRTIEVDYDLVDAPALHLGGWYDVFVRGTVRSFSELVRRGRPQQKLVIGPWHHMPWRPLSGAPADAGPPVADDWHLRFWREVLLDEPSGVFDSPVTAYVMNDGWRDLDHWPPSQMRGVDWYLHSGGRAASEFGDGALTTEPPAEEVPDTLGYDPDLPSMSVGGHSCCVEELVPMGPVDQSPRERTKLVLVYTSDALPDDLVLIGDVWMTLHAASTAPDTDFAARFCVVDEAGVSTNVLEGIVRARFRDSLADPTLIEPGRVYEYRIELGPVGRRVPAGHRLRVTISSSDFPQWDRNLNSGGPLYTETALAGKVAVQTILHDAGYPSRVTLPVLG